MHYVTNYRYSVAFLLSYLNKGECVVFASVSPKKCKLTFSCHTLSVWEVNNET
jgi:hypothetical protein